MKISFQDRKNFKTYDGPIQVWVTFCIMHRSTGSVFLYQKIDQMITENTKLFLDIKKSFSDIKKSLSDIKKRREKNQILDIRKSTLFSDIKNSIS